jgi:hypothetical protein
MLNKQSTTKGYPSHKQLAENTLKQQEVKEEITGKLANSSREMKMKTQYTKVAEIQ